MIDEKNCGQTVSVNKSLIKCTLFITHKQNTFQDPPPIRGTRISVVFFAPRTFSQSGDFGVSFLSERVTLLFFNGGEGRGVISDFPCWPVSWGGGGGDEKIPIREFGQGTENRQYYQAVSDARTVQSPSSKVTP
jgi:hypothetical protein